MLGTTALGVGSLLAVLCALVLIWSGQEMQSPDHVSLGIGLAVFGGITASACWMVSAAAQFSCATRDPSLVLNATIQSSGNSAGTRE